jgi:hypothetical protein
MTVPVTKRRTKMHKHDLYLRPEKKSGYWVEYDSMFYMFANMDLLAEARNKNHNLYPSYATNARFISYIVRPIAGRYYKRVVANIEYVLVKPFSKRDITLNQEKYYDSILTNMKFTKLGDGSYLRRQEYNVPTSCRIYNSVNRLDSLPDFIHFLELDHIPLDAA